jgi:HEAT repeat protein
MGPPGRLVLLVMLQNRNVELRRRAAIYWLTRFDPDDPEIVSGMAFMLDDDDVAIRRFALAAIQKAPSEYHRNYVEKLASMLDREVEDNPETRLTICRMVGMLKQEGRRAFIPLMTAVQRDPDASVRAGALEAALLVGRLPEIFEPLAFGITDKEPAVRLIAARSLRDLGREAEGTEQGLAEALSDTEAGVREAAAEALVNIGQRSAQPLILKLGAPNSDLKVIALDCLAKIGPAAREAIPALEHCTRDRDPNVRKHATSALAAIKGP